MKKVLFIGNRAGVFEKLSTFGELALTAVFAVRGSYLQKRLQESGTPHVAFAAAEKAEVIRRLSTVDFDLLISNGCPIIIPVSRIKRPHQLFLNIHPSLLPDLRGMHPINGAVLCQARYFGATMHFMDDSIDTGNIVHQERMELTDDLDLGLLYRQAFALEAEAFSRGMAKLIASNFRFAGTPQTGQSRYYTRSAADMTLDFDRMDQGELLRRIRAFGIKSLGVSAALSDGRYRIFQAERIDNPGLLEQFAGHPPGRVLFKYEDRFLVKTTDGIIKVTSHSPLE